MQDIPTTNYQCQKITHPPSTSNPSLSPFGRMLGSPLDDSTKKKKGGRPTELSFAGLKALLQEIQNRGGLKGLNLTDVCDTHPEELGAPNSTLRKSVQNKVGDWKRKPDRYHSDQIDTLGFLFERLESPLSSTPTPASPPPTNQSSHRVSLSRLLDNMSLNDHYGAVPHDMALNVNFTEAWNNDGAFIFKAPAVTVGENPSISKTVREPRRRRSQRGVVVHEEASSSSTKRRCLVVLSNRLCSVKLFLSCLCQAVFVKLSCCAVVGTKKQKDGSKKQRFFQRWGKSKHTSSAQRQ